MYQNFIGIDIGKFEFHVALEGEKSTDCYKNNESGHVDFLGKWEERLSNSLVVLEPTGGHEIGVIKALQEKGYAVHRASANKVKHFIRSLGQQSKTDAIDARCLALYGRERHSKLELYKEKGNEALRKLVSRRESLVGMLVKEKNRIQSPEQGIVQESITRMISHIEEEIEQIEVQIELIYKSDKQLSEMREELKEIAGIGDIVSSSLIGYLPELGLVNRKSIAALSGVAPYANDSGKRRGYRFTRGGRAEIKRILYTAAMAASKSKGRLGEFYRGLVESGKHKKVALMALMRKIIVIANAKIRDYLKAQGCLDV